MASNTCLVYNQVTLACLVYNQSCKIIQESNPLRTVINGKKGGRSLTCWFTWNRTSAYKINTLQ